MMRIKPPKKILVIADDLTGCGDVAYWAVLRGLACSICDIENLPKKVEPDVLLVNTNTRNSDKGSAYNLVSKVCNWAKTQDFDFIFKKMDSTLRGHFGKENDALFDSLSLDFLPLLAAYPEYARTTKDGVHYVDGVRIQDTPFSEDPKYPVKDSAIPTILKKTSKFFASTVVYDAKIDDDIDEAICTVFKVWHFLESKYKVATGTSKFFSKFLDHFGFKEKARATKKGSGREKFKNIVIIYASCNPKAREQIDELKKSVKFDNIEETKDFIIYQKPNLYVLESSRKINPDYSLTPIISKSKEIINTLDPPLIISSGGDTAHALCSALKIDTLDVIKPIEVGIILCKSPKTNTSIILKPGAFALPSFLKTLIKPCIS